MLLILIVLVLVFLLMRDEITQTSTQPPFIRLDDLHQSIPIG